MTTVHCSTVHFASRCHERWKIIEDWHISCRPLVFFAPRRLWRWSKKSRCFHFPPDGFPTRSQSRNNKSLQLPWRQTGELIKSLLFFLASVWCHMYPDTHTICTVYSLVNLMPSFCFKVAEYRKKPFFSPILSDFDTVGTTLAEAAVGTLIP